MRVWMLGVLPPCSEPIHLLLRHRDGGGVTSRELAPVPQSTGEVALGPRT